MDWWTIFFPPIGFIQAGMDLKEAADKKAQFEKDHPILSKVGGVFGAIILTVVALIILYILYRILTNPRVATAAGTAVKAAAI